MLTCHHKKKSKRLEHLMANETYWPWVVIQSMNTTVSQLRQTTNAKVCFKFKSRNSNNDVIFFLDERARQTAL
jgi:hypothetical protein